MSNSSLVTRLEGKLQQEAESRQLQNEVNYKLQTEYDILLKRLAEAENHIDKLRLGANLELNKHFVVTHEHRYGDTTEVGPMIPPHTPHTAACKTDMSVETNWDEANAQVSYSDKNILQNPPSPQQYRIDVSTDNETELVDHPLYEAMPSLGTDGDLSVTAIVDRASAESKQYAHLTKIKSLQRKISELQSKLNESGTPLNEVLCSLQEVQMEHRQLSEDIGQSQDALEALKKNDGQVSRRITSNQQAIGKEVRRCWSS